MFHTVFTVAIVLLDFAIPNGIGLPSTIVRFSAPKALLPFSVLMRIVDPFTIYSCGSHVSLPQPNLIQPLLGWQK